jgi:ABC-2 type transport system ATP-binding protein
MTLTAPSFEHEPQAPDDSKLHELLRSEVPHRNGGSNIALDPLGASDAIAVESLVKHYPDGTEAVRGISFTVGTGEVYGMLGPNGAGKSTTIGILGTLVRPTAGHATVAGFDVAARPKEVRRRIGFAMQEVGVDELATGSEFLMLQGRLHGLSRREAARRADLLLGLLELESAANQRIGAYSGGMKRRIDLASALIHLPPILFLDEPTEGLDPRARVAIWETLERLNAALQMTIVLTTHYMEEADRLCGRIGIIDRGLIVGEGTPAELKASVGGQTLSLRYAPQSSSELLPRVRASLLARDDVLAVVASGSELSVEVEDAAAVAPELLRVLQHEWAAPQALSIKQPTLEDVYLRSTGRSFGEAEAARSHVGIDRREAA